MQVGLHVGRRWAGHGECKAAVLVGVSSRRRQRSIERCGHNVAPAGGHVWDECPSGSFVGEMAGRAEK